MTTTTIQDTITLWTNEPEKAKGKPTVKARTDGSQAVLESGSFSWRADLPNVLGGGNQAPSPTALLLSALAGCAVVFIVDTLAPRLGVHVNGVEATAQCDADSRGLLDMDGVAPDLQNVGLTIQIDSPDGEQAIGRLIAEWKARCPIYLALTKPVEVTLSVSVK